MLNVAVLVSGGGTNLQALIDAQERGEIIGGKICRVISSKPGAYALERAAKANIPTSVVDRKRYGSSYDFDDAILFALQNANADLIVLAGFMYILGEKVTKKYEYKIINVHPALIPSFSGKGFYGLRVHQAALDYGVKLTGATVHFVNEHADAGPIILQKSVDIKNGDTPEILQKRVMQQAEWVILPKAVSLFCQDKIEIKDNKAYIKE
ncbi:MAG: phosphoribosylglycinamide formyltransferase [Oscillospiraceae bacterium]|jgi:phosphoribosylglycinamide formyltransferase-1|nr:phosphoribosylglycinamide formyltransferase [Oscillospiraceae bacterium]